MPSVHARPLAAGDSGVPRSSEVLTAARAASVDVVLTSFEAARDHVTALNQVRWTAVIVDEVHRLKNPASQTTRALSALLCRRRVGLSGTVVQVRRLLVLTYQTHHRAPV